MSFAIMRMEKIKSPRGVAGALDHNTRKTIPKNADPEKTKSNVVYGLVDERDELTPYQRYKSLLPEKVRKNAVHAVEILCTSDKDWNGNWEEYLSASKKWADSIFGDGNFVHGTIHFDEKTPHAHFVYVPLKDGKLNAKHFIGGHRDRMAELQTHFFEVVGKPHGLNRGKSAKETRARHTHHSLKIDYERLKTEREELIKISENLEKEFEEREKKLIEDEKKFKTESTDWVDRFEKEVQKPLEEREEKLEKEKEELNKLLNLKTAIKNDVEIKKIYSMTAAALRTQANKIESGGFANYGEYKISLQNKKDETIKKQR